MTDYFKSYKERNEIYFELSKLKKQMEKQGKIIEEPHRIPKRLPEIKESKPTKYLQFRKQEKILKEEFLKKQEKPDEAENLIHEPQENSEKIVEDVKKNLERDFGLPLNFHDSNFLILKLLILLIPLIIVLYLVYTNYIQSQDFYYFYDIGSDSDLKSPVLSPLDRISNVSQEVNISFRELNKNLVYFNAPIPRNSKQINVEFRFKDNFPEYPSMSVGAKDQEAWHYVYKQISIPFFENISQIEDLSKIKYTDWLVAETNFDIQTDGLYVKDNKLSMLFNIPHLSKPDYFNNTIPIDWIKITVHKPGLFEKWNQKN